MTVTGWGRKWHERKYDLSRMDLRQLLRAYFTYPAIQVYLLLCALAGLYALYATSDWIRTGLAAIFAGLVYPLAWYIIHRFILHGRFLYKSPLTAGLWKRIHFDHHQDPHRLDVLFGALNHTVPTIALVTIPLGWLIGSGSAAAAAFSVGLATTCFYEFCHCIEHLNYTPRFRLLRRMKQLHLAHHFHNESGNYGITNFAYDRLFGTYYGQPREAPRSPHVFNLGYDPREAERYPWVRDLTGAPPRSRPPSMRERYSNAEAL